MKRKVLLLCSIGSIFLMGCTSPNISKRLDNDTRAQMSETYKKGETLEPTGANLIKDVRGTIIQPIRK